MPNAILDPTGAVTVADVSSSTELAPRRADLNGARIGLLENTKHNAALLLDELGKLLVAEFPGATISVQETKQQFALPIPEEKLGALRDACDVVITGVGDCGSCSASAVTDGILFERAGIPSAVIVTDAFHTTAGAMREMQGMPGYPYIDTEHPMAVLTEEQVKQRAKHLLPEVIRQLTSGEGA